MSNTYTPAAMLFGRRIRIVYVIIGKPVQPAELAQVLRRFASKGADMNRGDSTPLLSVGR